jgi:hypothetical protein
MPFTYPFNLTAAAASVPVGVGDSELPVGLQIVGRRHADRTVLAAAHAFETACPWVERRPSSDAVPGGRRALSERARWMLLVAVLGALLTVTTWLVATDAPVIRVLVRMYSDKHYLKSLVASWEWMAPLVFIIIQALQVVISPFPGEITGPVGAPSSARCGA